MKARITMTVEAHDGSSAEDVAYALAQHCDIEGWEASSVTWEDMSSNALTGGKENKSLREWVVGHK